MSKVRLVTILLFVLTIAVSSAYAGDINQGALGPNNFRDQVLNNNENNAIGVGVGIGIGGTGGSVNNSGNSTNLIGNTMFGDTFSPSASANNDVDIEVNPRITNNNMDINYNDVDVDVGPQIQGQIQGQSVDNRDTFIYNAPRGFGGAPNAYGVEDFQQLPPEQGYSNTYFWFPKVATWSTCSGLDIPEGYLWGTRTTVKVLSSKKREKAGSISRVEGMTAQKDPYAIITVRGNTGTKAYELVGHALSKAMALGCTQYEVVAQGFETRGRGLNLGLGGSTSYQQIYSKFDSRQIASTGGAGVSWGSSAIKARAYVTILAF